MMFPPEQRDVKNVKRKERVGLQYECVLYVGILAVEILLEECMQENTLKAQTIQ
jgi:hypothetical protein